ncbi:MAG TPA: ABC transporter ATP-binding protein [Eubacteriaceae bacterium]|nr:ABC transporter ATP-binding protein [Eubacteriaceae bacterium]
MLVLKDVNVYYGSIQALRDVNIKIEKGEIVTLIGSNGAGKSTILRTISAIVKPISGDILYNGEAIQSFLAPNIVKLGISHSPEGRRVFSTMTVMENLELGAYTRKDKKQIKEDFDYVFSLFPILHERKYQLAGTLSGGEQQMLAMARALLSRPKLLLLDEPSLGLAPLIVNDIFSIIKDINESGTTILLVEQNANKALQIADRAYIIQNGNIVIEGSANDLLNDNRIKKSYLGG